MMGDNQRVTILRPPPGDPNKAPIENILEVTELTALGPNIYTNARQPWHPSGARGIYGGSVIALCLSAGQKTVPVDFLPHSCHSYFLLAGRGDLPILLHVERLRDGRSFCTRTVQARQRGAVIFTVTISFVRHGAAGPPTSQVRHAFPMPRGVDGQPLRPPPDDWDGEPEREEAPSHDDAGGGERKGEGDIRGNKAAAAGHQDNKPMEKRTLGPGPFQNYRIDIANRDSPHPYEKKTLRWTRARGSIQGGHQAHLNALAYMSDSYFIGTITRIHGLWQFPVSAARVPELSGHVRTYIERVSDWEGLGHPKDMKDAKEIGMMVSLDHSIYFHEPTRVRADEWMVAEMESPWASDGRGVVTQRIFSKDGTLIATCFQEGVVRLKEPAKPESRASKI